jgi:hypothetical protein
MAVNLLPDPQSGPMEEPPAADPRDWDRESWSVRQHEKPLVIGFLNDYLTETLTTQQCLTNGV